MPLDSFSAKTLRCLSEARLDLHAERNYLFGMNGAGKTSLLEAIHVLGRGRSFRVRSNAQLVQKGASGFTVTGVVGVAGGGRRRVGVEFERGRMRLRLDGEPVQKASILAEVLPVHVLDPGMHGLIGGGPSLRRRALDWGVFHVERSYLSHWREYRRALAQRNAALKSRVRGDGLAVWDERYISSGESVDAARRRYVGVWAHHVAEIGARLLGAELGLALDSGGFAAGGLRASLLEAGERDARRGMCHVGPHRADLSLALDGQNVRDMASRGQQKLAAAALILAQVAVFAETAGEPGILLVDDPAAELDPLGLRRLLAELDGLNVQMVVTGISPMALEPLADGHVFHVEQGVIERRR
jgi:DNA replication and repair protein RecF